jgi:ABC-2 type transport system permease protein
MSGGFMLTSVSKEKENRTVEVLLVSLKARDLMLGKIVGLAGVGLLQMTIWLGVGLLGLSQARRMIENAGDFGLPAGFVPWTLAYFLLGFFLYAAIFAMLGVMASSLRQANQLIYVAIIPLIIPLILATTLIEQPDAALSVALSLFPLTSPVAMVTRLAAGPVPLWQLLLGLALLGAAAYAVVLLAARFFQVENLLSKQSFSWRRMAGQLRPGR